MARFAAGRTGRRAQLGIMPCERARDCVLVCSMFSQYSKLEKGQ